MRLSMFEHFKLLVPVFSDITLLSKATMAESAACFDSAYYNRVRSLSESIPEFQNFAVKEVPPGNTTVLSCLSNDLKHNFMFWLFNGTDVIGPGNTYNQEKYKYNVLSGDLHIYDVSPKESGFYHCISKKLDGVGFSVGQIDMIVTGAGFTPMDALKLVAIVLSIIVIISCVALYFHLKQDWRKYDGRAVVVPVDEIEEDEDGGDEVYNRTTTSISQPSPQPGPSRNPSSEQLLYGIDNQGLDTDFNSVFENIQIKSPQASLI